MQEREASGLAGFRGVGRGGEHDSLGRARCELHAQAIILLAQNRLLLLHEA